MSFVFQQPGSAGLLAAIDAAAKGATAAGSMFAFATKKGIERLLSAQNIAHMLSDGSTFHLIVGVDAITNADSLLYLEDRVAEFGGALKAHAFIHNYSGTFHPKFSWFQKPTLLTLIIGSGNLTLSGLGQTGTAAAPPGNWEAFSVQPLTDQSAAAAAQAIDDWIRSNIELGNLRSLDDSDVRDQAMANSRVRYIKPARLSPSKKLAAGGATATADIAATSGIPTVREDDVLIRELPQTRPGQGDIGVKGLEFLGFNGIATTILLQHVNLDNSLGPVTEQRLFVNSSKNRRVELGAIVQHGYTVDEHDNRMILIAIKLDDRSFRYTVVPVTDPNYALVSSLLGSPLRLGAGRPMRVLTMNSQPLREAWPGAPENLLPVSVLAVET